MFKLIKKFMNFAGKQKKKLSISLIYAVLLCIFKAFDIFAIGTVFKAILENNVNTGTIWLAFGLMAIGIVGGIVFKKLSCIRQTEAGYNMVAESRISIAERLKYMPMGYFNKNNLGKITNISTNIEESLQETLTTCFQTYIQGILMTTVITIAMFVFDWKIGLITLGGLVVFLSVNTLMHKKANKVSKRKIESTEKLVDNILEYVQGISIVKSYNLIGSANKKVNKAIDDDFHTAYNMERKYIPFMGIQTLITKIFSLTMVICSVAFYVAGSMSLLNCLMICISSFIIYAELEAAGSMSGLLRVASLSIDEINEVHDSPIMDGNGKDIETKNKNIKIENVDFSYGERKIIDNVSLDIPEGSTVAIVGNSGGGKTTLCNLITRFWDVDSGKISLGGVDVKDYTLDSLLKNFSMVFQSVYLFDDTIANNIKFGKPDATIDEVRSAAKKACCDEFIMALPNGYDTIIGEAGASISGGEKQRISIARAIIKDSPIIILDEATANVDPENEKQLQLAIEELTKSKTVIMIAHRLKTVRNADKIVVINDGKIVEEGNHKQLMTNKGHYSDFIGMREKSIGWKLGEQKAS